MVAYFFNLLYEEVLHVIHMSHHKVIIIIHLAAFAIQRSSPISSTS